MWGSKVSQGYQAACFKVRDVELVKNRSAIGMVLEYRADTCAVTRNTPATSCGSRGKKTQRHNEKLLKFLSVLL